MKKIIRVYGREFVVDIEKITTDVAAGSSKVIFVGIKDGSDDEIKFFVIGVSNGKESCAVLSGIASSMKIGKVMYCGNHNRCERFEVAIVCSQFCIDSDSSSFPKIYVFGDVALSEKYTGMLCYPKRYIKDEFFYSTDIEFWEARQQIEEIVSNLGYNIVHEKWTVEIESKLGRHKFYKV